MKQRRVDEAEKVVREKELALKNEQEKLKGLEEQRDIVKAHKKDKLQQLRDELDQCQGTTTGTIQQMKTYLKIVDEKLAVEEKKVKEQMEKVKAAENNLTQAKLDLQRKRHEVDKIAAHRKDWEKEMRKEQEIIEGREQDELGSIIHTTHQRKR